PFACARGWRSSVDRPGKEASVKRRISFVLAAALVAGLIAGAVPAGAAGSNAARFDARRYLKQHGYLPLRGVATLRRAKAHAAAVVARSRPSAPPASPAAGATTPSIGSSWNGTAQ